MPNIFDDPEVKAAMAAAGVVYKPGIAQEVLRDLAPFLAEEGIDLSDPGDADLETLNAAFARATSRYNQGLPPVHEVRPGSSVRQPAAGSPFIRRPSAVPTLQLGASNITAPSASGPASGRSVQRDKRASGQPKLSNADRSVVREFERWLRWQPEIAAPRPADESGMLTELFKVARHHGFHLRTPGGVEDLIALLLGVDHEQERDGALAAAVDTLHDYVHFRVETGGDPSAWEVIHDLFDDPLPGADILQAAIVESEQVAPDVRRDALAGTQVVANVAELLGWIGSGRKVAPSGGVRRVDIAHAAGLLGIAAVGVDRLSPSAADSPALIEIEPDRSPPDAIRARSMKDVPLLPSWWRALTAAELIEVTGSRVVPGPSAAGWTAESLPPTELAEEVVGLTVFEYICEDLDVRSAFYAGEVAAITIARMLGALDPQQVELSLDEDELDRLLQARATHHLQRLVRVGVLASDAEGDFVVPDALRGAVARGVLAALAVLGDAIETD